ncbi:MAG TPA: FecR family protein [Devosiaceae bacterium]
MAESITRTVRAFRVVIALLAFATSLALAGSALAVTGTAVGVSPQADLKAGGVTRTLVMGADVSVGDTVVTDAGGQVQILFGDNTRVVVGPNSSLLIEEYLLGTGNQVSKFAIKALGGTYRFITGNSPKEAYVIKTPTGTIGVRGTAFDWAVDLVSKITTVVRYEGKVILCPYGPGETQTTDLLKCVVLTQQCSTGELVFDKDAHIIEIEKERLSRVGDLFPYIISQQPLRSDFRVPDGTACGQPLNPPEPEKHPGGGEPGNSGNECGECCYDCG